MNRFDCNTSRRPSRLLIASLVILSTFSAIGCATGKQGFTPSPVQGPLEQAPVGTLSPPQPTPAQPTPTESGPLIQPRDSYRRPYGQQQAEYGQRRGFGFSSPPRITPRNVPSPLASPVDSPLIRHTPPPAELSGKIEIVPNSHAADSTSQRTYFDIVPNEPAKLNPEGVELLPSPEHGRYEELPPPPE